MMRKLATIGVCAIVLLGGIAASASAGSRSGGGHAGSTPGHGPPAGYQEPHYGSAAFSDHPNEAQTQFLGPNTVLGKMFRYNSNSDQVAATAASPKGG
jgi:hypothetical protein